ncbi:EAL domain-containing protein [Litoribrevibacter albus]|uniref:cyclic-guanylate-specific phosphodiesterase n=1 Tax=Litoribrevibacter albus TaxID=1473156 RepID=A0AA37S8P4_9GAMM|nr:EAL domain-containing protein [Litoribrevibacter albus]GLQ30198.1 hypothetical protein GCM10007876_06760 [Litoribrevibacter albus]
MSASQVSYLRLFSLKTWWFPTLLCLGLVGVWANSPLLFHTLAEFFSISVAVITLVVAWNTFVLSHNHYLMWLGIGYLGVGILDGAHALTFKGMPFVHFLDSDTTLQYWIIARYFEAIVLIAAPFYIKPLVNRYSVFAVIIGLVTVLIMMVPLGVFPEMFHTQTGLTPIKVMNEWIIIGLLVVAGYLNYNARDHLEPKTVQLILISIGFTIIAEVLFTLYANLYGFTIIMGHFFKLFSFWAIYVALIESSLREPFKNLSRGANTYDAIPEEISLVDREGRVRQVNKAICLQLNKTQQDCLEQSCHELQHNVEESVEECEICRAILSHQSLEQYRFYHPKDEQWYEVSLSPIAFSSHQAGMVHVRRNVTEEKVAQDRLNTMNRLYTVQTHTNKAIIGAVDREDLFQRICDIAVKEGEFLLAWVGLVKHDTVVPSCFSGEGKDYLKEMKMTVDDSALAKGPVGRAAKTGMVQYVNDTSSDPTFVPWRDAAVERGFQAVAAVPIKVDNQVVGIFTIYSQLPEVFGKEMVSLLSSISDDLSAAMVMISKERRRLDAEKKLHNLSQAVEQSANAIIITDTASRIEYVNRSFTVLTGYLPEEVIGLKPNILRSEYTSDETLQEIREALEMGREWHGKIQNRRKDGSIYWSRQSIFCIRDEMGNIIQYASTSEDHTELHEAQETIKQLAFFDPLTQLPNRRLLGDRFKQEFRRQGRNDEASLAVMMLDLDNFKTVNDSLGHSVGDSLLVHVAAVLQGCVRSEDTVSRLGGDEFAILVGGASVERVTGIADSIIHALSAPVELEGNLVQVGASVGISLYPQDAQTSEDLMKNADLAMYHAKSEGKNNFQFFRDELNTKAHDRLLLENRIRTAIENEHFQLYYQPQIHLASGNVVGLEALIRWVDPDRGVISPAEFIPLAEDTGMIGRIGDWVIETACKDVQQMHLAGLEDIKVAVNVSAHQFRNGQHLCRVIQNALETHKLDPKYLSLELTESILIEDINETIQSLNDLKGLNITLAIDDFGTGYSSLSYLKTFPIDVLKIDQSFIRDILSDDSDKAIVTAIIAMAKQLDLNVLAEGVETMAHNDVLKEFGCDFAQGYYYCKPIPVETLIKHYAK